VWWRDVIERDFERRQGRRASGILIGFVLLIPVAIGTVAYRMIRRPAPAVPAAARHAVDHRVPAPVVAPTAVPRVDLPKLESSDAFIRELARILSANPEWARWLAGEGLVRRLTASVDNVAEGRSPIPHLFFLAPKEPFRAREQPNSTTIDPASYHRYDLVADVVASLDVKGCARLYGETRPLFQDAYRELGYPGRNFDERLAKAIQVLLATPEPKGEIELRPGVKSWRLADPALQSLSPVQKQLLRMGPDNVAKIKGKLREIAEALDLPA
jgi:Protein of unknown function (DUF3014)